MFIFISFLILSFLFTAALLFVFNSCSGIYLGGALASLSIILDTQVGWRDTVKIIGVVGLLATISCIVLVPEPRKKVQMIDSIETSTSTETERNESKTNTDSKGTSNLFTESIGALSEVLSSTEAKLLFSATALRYDDMTYLCSKV